MVTEEWRAIPNFPGYQASPLGRIKGKSGRVLKGTRTQSGHVIHELRVNGVRKNRMAHVLILETFVGPSPVGMEGCHGNEIPDDNRLENLRWDTRSENMLDLVRAGTHWQTKKTHCPRQHEYNAANTRYCKTQRICRLCQKISSAERRRAAAA